MGDDVVRSGEFNAAVGALRESVDNVKASLDYLSKEVSELRKKHEECGRARENTAYQRGLEAGRLDSIEKRVGAIEASSTETAKHKRVVLGGIIVSTFGAAASIILSLWGKAIAK